MSGNGSSPNGHILKRTIFDAFTLGYLACILLIAIVPQNDEGMLLLGRNTMVFLGLCIFGAIVSAVVNRVGMKTLGELIFEPSYKKVQSVEQHWYASFWG